MAGACVDSLEKGACASRLGKHVLDLGRSPHGGPVDWIMGVGASVQRGDANPAPIGTDDRA
jgi:hypothetical protein